MCIAIFIEEGIINILQNIKLSFVWTIEHIPNKSSITSYFLTVLTALLLHVTSIEGKEIPGTPGKINPGGKQCSRPATNHYNELCSTVRTLLDELNLSIHQRPTQTSQMLLWRLKPAGSSRSSPALPDLSQHALVQSTAGSQHAQVLCSGIFIQQSPTAKTLSRKKWKLKGPKHHTLQVCSLHAVPFNDSLDQSGDGREK